LISDRHTGEIHHGDRALIDAVFFDVNAVAATEGIRTLEA
jgi:hypothetical protein